MPQSIKQIQDMLQAKGLQPRHRFGQNFLHDHNKIRDILEAGELQAGESILEVGPGTGTLSEAMLEHGIMLHAVEIDRDLADILRSYFEDQPNFNLIEGDVLESKSKLNPAIADAFGGQDQPFKLIANLPYQITSPLLITLANDWPGMQLAVIMMQKEVGDRILAKPGSKAYGPLGILLQVHFEIEMVCTLSPNCFWPKPKINSAVLKMQRRDKPLTEHPEEFSQVVHKLFGQRRKQCRKTLGKDFPFPEGFDVSLRPEQLSIKQLNELATCAANA